MTPRGEVTLVIHSGRDVPVNYRKIGRTDVEISKIRLGAEHLENEDPKVVRIDIGGQHGKSSI